MNQNAVVLLALGLATHAAGAQAQDVPSGAVADDKSAESFAGLEEVVVTARFKEERLQTIGLSAVALSGESLRDAGASTFQDIAGQMAGLNLSDRGPNRIDVSFRGMANVTEGNDWQRSTATVGIYLDDVSVVTPFPTQRSWNMFDVSRVEVVRGPQGTLYGEGAMGGAVRFVTQDPSLERFEGRVAASWGSYSHSSGNNWRGDATFSMPLIDDVLGLRLTAFKQDDAGFIDFTGAGVRDANSFESSGGRIVLLAKPSENLRVRTSVTYEYSDLASEWKVTDVPERLLNTNNFALEPQQDSALVASARVDYTASFGELSAITGYWDRERRDRGLEPNVTFAFLPVTKDFQMNDRGFSQELRFVSEPIGKARVTMAAYYKSSDQEFDALEESAVLSFPGSLLIEKEEYSGKQYSVSSELSYAWTDALTTTVGARYFKENIDTYQLWTEPEIVFTIPRAEFHTELPIEEVLPKVLVEYRATPDLLFYGGATRGARNGNLIYTSILVISDSYGLALPRTSDADSAWSYEIGTKTSWLDNRLTANVALYYIDWQDLQMTASTPPYSVGGGVLSFVYSANVGSARSVGGEVDVAWRPSQYFNVNLSAGYTDAKLGNEVLIDAVSGIRVPKDAMIPFTPEYKGAVTIAGRYPLGTALTATTNIGVQHIGPQASRLRQIPDDPVQPYEKYPAYTIVDVRAGVEWNDWTVTAFVRNATDKIVGVTGAAGFNYRVNTPRTIGLMVSTSF